MTDTTTTTTTTAVPTFTVDAYALRNALQLLKPAMPRRGSDALPILDMVAMFGDRGALVLSATDLELTVSVPLEVHALSMGPGSDDLGRRPVTCVPFGTLHSLFGKAKKTTGPATFTVVDRYTCQVEVDGLASTVTTGDVNDWPRLPMYWAGELVHDATMTPAVLADVVDAAATHPARPILTGVLFDEGRIVATDSYRLHWAELGYSVTGDHGPQLVPSRAVKHAAKCAIKAKAATVGVAWQDRTVTFTAGDATVTTRLIEGEFPNYRRLVPDTMPALVTFNRAQLVDAVKRMGEIARAAGPATPVRLQMVDAATCTVAVEADGRRQEMTVGCSVTGTGGIGLVVGFNPAYLLDMIGGTLGTRDTVTIGFVDGLKPALVREAPGVAERVRLLMPVRGV